MMLQDPIGPGYLLGKRAPELKMDSRVGTEQQMVSFIGVIALTLLLFHSFFFFGNYR